MAPGLSYCGQMVRDNDPDRFLISLFAPADRREALWALFAFNHEIAKTREVVSETMMGLMRLQWWRDAVSAIYDGTPVPDHAVLNELRNAIKKYNLPRDCFETLIYAREFDLETVLPSNMAGFLNYADFTSTPLMKLAVIVAGGDAEYEPVQAVAANYALAGLLRAVRFHAMHGRCFLPEDLLQKHGVTLRQITDFLKPEEGLRAMAKEMASHFVSKPRPRLRMIRAAEGLAEIYITHIKRCGYDLFSPEIQIPPPFKELRVFLKTLL